MFQNSDHRLRSGMSTLPGDPFAGPAGRALRALSSGGALPEEDLRATQALLLATSRTFGPGEEVAGIDEPPEFLHLLLDGWMAQSGGIGETRRQTVALMVPGDCGDTRDFLLERTGHGLRALTRATVARVPRPLVEAEMARRPALATALQRRAARAAVMQRERILSMGLRSGEEHLAYLLCELFFRLRDVGLTEGKSYELPLRQGELGEVLGLSNVHVSRLFHELRGRQLITYRYPILTIGSVTALMQAALMEASAERQVPEDPAAA